MQWTQYEIMQGDKKVAAIRRNGSSLILDAQRMPYNLYLEEETDIDTLVQNLDNFYHWCASRVLTLDRQYAKEILNSIGASQSATDRERAEIALSYHCVSLRDIFWVKEGEEAVTFEQVNLYENHLSSAFVDISLRGKQMTVENRQLLAGDLSTQGCFPKAWVRRADGFYLLKDGGIDAVENELLASRICQCFRCNQVAYEAGSYDGQKVSVSKIITSLKQSIVSMEYFEIYAMNHDIDKMDYIMQLDGYSYDMMNIIDYLVGNTDRHWGNWGLLVDNESNQPRRLYDLMDFNRAFQAYDSIEGAGCLAAGKRQSQLEAAIEGVKRSGLNQVAEVDQEWFADRKQYVMFSMRLGKLREVANMFTHLHIS